MPSGREIADTLRVGDVAGEVAVTVTDAMVDAYAAAVGDFSPLFMMTDNFGEAYLAGGEISVSFIKPVRPGDAIRGRGVVQEIRVEGAKHRLTCEVWLENQDGEKTTVGTASAVAVGQAREREE